MSLQANKQSILSSSSCSSLGSNEVRPLFETIPQYSQILDDLSHGNLKADFDLHQRKSKLCHSLRHILYESSISSSNDELSYFILFMESNGQSNYVKFLLDLENFERVCLLQSSSSVSLTDDRKNEINQAISKDAISLYSRYITQDAPYSINASDEILSETTKSICPENGKAISFDCFDKAKQFVFNLIEQQYYDKYLVSEYHCKYLLDVIKSRSLTLSDVLYDDIAIVFLLEYLENENASQLLKFWIQVDNFSRNALNIESSQKQQQQQIKSRQELESIYKQLQNDAMIIYDNFISLQAKYPLGFDDLVRCQVEMNICQHSTQDSDENKLQENGIDQNDFYYLISSYANCFYLPLLIVYNVLDKLFFTRFIQSPMYKKYMDEVRLNSNFLVKQQPKETTTTPKRGGNKKVSFLLDDDTDSLWRRPNASNLQIGRIDSRGRYIRHLSSDPDDEAASTRSLLSTTTADDDDVWSLGGSATSDIEIDLTKYKKPSTSKLTLDRLKSLIPPIITNSRSSSISNLEEQKEEAERIAAMIVNDVIKINSSQ